MDAEGGGRLIYYDFGMMGTIPGDVRAGLLELFYGVYQKDPDRCIEALISMGVLVPGGDRVAVRRTAVFFLKSFEVPPCPVLVFYYSFSAVARRAMHRSWRCSLNVALLVSAMRGEASLCMKTITVAQDLDMLLVCDFT